MRALLVFLLTLATASCATHDVAREPQDLVGPGQRIETLLGYGWQIDPPVDPSAVLPSWHLDAPSANDGQSWAAFLGGVAPGDELRRVENNAGQGYAVFRNGLLVSLYLSTIY